MTAFTEGYRQGKQGDGMIVRAGSRLHCREFRWSCSVRGLPLLAVFLFVAGTLASGLAPAAGAEPGNAFNRSSGQACDRISAIAQSPLHAPALAQETDAPSLSGFARPRSPALPPHAEHPSKTRKSLISLFLFLPLAVVLIVALGFLAVIVKGMVWQAQSQVIAISEPPPHRRRKTSRPIALTDTAT
jgi:hypothetical protein